jgi:hypothetical protein
MSTATAPALKSVEAFRADVSLFRCDLGAPVSAYPFVITCPDGTVLWGQRLPETTDQADKKTRTLPEIVADKVMVTHASGWIEELVCHDVPAPLVDAEMIRN